MRISLNLAVIKKFYVADLARAGIHADSDLVKRANNLLDDIPTRFDFNIGLATTTAYRTQYTLNPPSTILVKEGATELRRILIHELAHHCWYFVADDANKAQLIKVCEKRGLDANEQFASSVEYWTMGNCIRFEQNDPTTSKELAVKIKDIVQQYFVL